ncbi:MAG TPA: hypothetical protein DDX29_00500 [Clostridiales bacterium]|nr:hypothetical protein [Clostridiales bacterium]
MKKESVDIKISDLKKEFNKIQYIDKKDLLDFYIQFYPELTNQNFRRILYSLEKNEVISSSGSGLFYLNLNENSPKKKYLPSPSQSLRILNEKMKYKFPHLDFLIWETKFLNEFMVHQIGVNHIILDVERGTEASVFNQISEEYSGNIFLNPDIFTMESYVQQLSEAIIISNLISQTPLGRKEKKISFAPIEKILVDLLVDDEKFFSFQGNELISIYNEVFNSYLINIKSLIRYAGRRKAIPELKKFIINKTQVEIGNLTSEKK